MLLGPELPPLYFMVSLLFVLVVGFTVHEYAHARVADYFGDDTPRIYGRLTLNPIVHIDVIGALMLLFAGFGWAKPVPVNPSALGRRDPRAMMWVALAGPTSNLLMAIVASLPVRLGLVTQSPSGPVLPSLFYLLNIFVLYNLILFFFNMIPLFPLDGEKIATELLPYEGQRVLDRARPYGAMPLILVMLLTPMVGLPVLKWLVFNPASWITSLLLK